MELPSDILLLQITDEEVLKILEEPLAKEAKPKNKKKKKTKKAAAKDDDEESSDDE